MKEKIKFDKFDDYLAFLISTILSPYISATVFIVIITYAYSQNLTQFLPWMGTFFLFAILIPGIYVLWLIEIGKISDIHISDQNERKIPFIVAGVSSLIGVVLLVVLQAARPVIMIAVAYAVNAMMVAIITQFWKISIHTALFSSVATIAVIVFGPRFVWLYLLLLPLSWSRVHRHRHSLLQVVAGALLAFVLTTATFWAFGYL